MLDQQAYDLLDLHRAVAKDDGTGAITGEGEPICLVNTQFRWVRQDIAVTDDRHKAVDHLTT